MTLTEYMHTDDVDLLRREIAETIRQIGPEASIDYDDDVTLDRLDFLWFAGNNPRLSFEDVKPMTPYVYDIVLTRDDCPLTFLIEWATQSERPLVQEFALAQIERRGVLEFFAE